MSSRYLTINQSGSVFFGTKGKISGDCPNRIGRVTLNFVLFSLICVFGVFYIFEVNNAATKGYQIGELEKQVDELKKSNEILKIRAAELKSMYNIEERTKELNMIAPRDISYLNIPGNMAMNHQGSVINEQ